MVPRRLYSTAFSMQNQPRCAIAQWVRVGSVDKTKKSDFDMKKYQDLDLIRFKRIAVTTGIMLPLQNSISYPNPPSSKSQGKD